MDSSEGERTSIALSTYMDRAITGTQEEVDIRRRRHVLTKRIENYSNLNDRDLYCTFYAGSRGEGLNLKESDMDLMKIAKTVTVMYPGQFIPPSMANNTILYMRDADCRPGYVHLQLGQIGQKCPIELHNSLVRIKDSFFVSSDIFRESCVHELNSLTFSAWKSNGPSSSFGDQTYSVDVVYSFPCSCWPKEANGWITRTRLYGWPHQTLIDNIVHSGCHLVPVGDKCSEDTFLQWRISFATAERSLVHSFSHIQFKVYALLKCFLKQMKVTLKETIGDDDILCSYFLKTILFHAIENSSQLFWQEKHLLYCFWFCFNILIAWVRAGVCPNYFIPANNLFQRKVHGQHQQILLDILKNFCQLNIFNPSIWETPVCPRTEMDIIFCQDIETAKAISALPFTTGTGTLRDIRKAIHLLSKSQSDFDEVFTYQYSMICLQRLAAEQVSQDHYAMDNKTRYKSLRKCKNWMIHGASMGTELLHLATFHFLTGNFIKSFEMCKQVMKLASCFRLFRLNHYMYSEEEIVEMFRYGYRQSGHTSERLQKIYTGFITLTDKDLYLPHLSLEMTNDNGLRRLLIPPLPYAIFLSFLCSHELRDTRGRDAALRDMVDVQNDKNQGGHKNWIVDTLLGICYEILGDSHMAIRAYWNSAQRQININIFYKNPAIKRIAIVYLCMYASQKFNRG